MGLSSNSNDVLIRRIGVHKGKATWDTIWKGARRRDRRSEFDWGALHACLEVSKWNHFVQTNIYEWRRFQR
jgi:hypothetical protein